MPAHRAPASSRAPRASAGGRHRAAGRPRTAGPRIAALGTTGITATAVLGLGLGLAAPLDAGATVHPAAVDGRSGALVGTPVHLGGLPAVAPRISAHIGRHASRTDSATIRSGALEISAPAAAPATRATHRAVADSLGLRAVELAATRAGDPYVYGAEGPRAFDCSGLVMWVYDRLGKDLPRTAGAQYDVTDHVSHSAARVGDLIFFARGGEVYHVAIYAGHGWIWAAPYPGRDVEKEKLWTSSFMVGRVR